MTRVCGKIDPELTTILQESGFTPELHGQTRRGMDRICLDIAPDQALAILEASVKSGTVMEGGTEVEEGEVLFISRGLAKQLQAQNEQAETQGEGVVSPLDLALQSWSENFDADDVAPLYTVNGEGIFDGGSISQISAQAMAASTNPVEGQIRDFAIQVQKFISTDFYAGITTNEGLVAAGRNHTAQLKGIEATFSTVQEACLTLETYQQDSCHQVLEALNAQFQKSNTQKVARYTELESSIAAQAQKAADKPKGKADSTKEDNKPASSAERPRRR